MKHIKLILITIFLIFLSSCNNATDKDIETIQSTKQPDIPVFNQSALEGKKELVWISGNETNEIDPKIINAVNMRLHELGCNFYIQLNFCKEDKDKVSKFTFDPTNENYQNTLREYKRKGLQADIISTGYIERENNDEYKKKGASYIKAAQDGLLTPLSMYLDSKKGRNIKNLYPNTTWERLKIDKEVYGIVPLFEYSMMTYVIFNKRIIDQAIKEGHIDKLPKHISPNNILSVVNAIPLNDGIVKLYIEKNTAKEHIAWDGLSEGDYSAESRTSVFRGDFLVAVMPMNIKDIYNGDFHFFAEDDSYIEVYSYKYAPNIIRTPFVNAVTGVASWSKKKKEAYQFIEMVMTDIELSNLLQHGIKGIHYNLVDGKVKRTPKNNITFYKPGDIELDCFANHTITHPIWSEPLESKADIYTKFNNTYEYKLDWDLDLGE